jgi:hypothetical protein
MSLTLDISTYLCYLEDMRNLRMFLALAVIMVGITSFLLIGRVFGSGVLPGVLFISFLWFSIIVGGRLVDY